MLWRVRTTMEDRPGSLAVLSRYCGEQDVNILGLQIFPGVSGVTDELVLRAPDWWRTHDVALLVHDAGGSDITVSSCTEHALVDGPIQYLHALRRVAHDPSTLVEMLARLLDAEPTGTSRHDPTGDDTILVTVGMRRVTLGRSTPFTATEHARAVAFAEIARELVETEPSETGPIETGPIETGPIEVGPAETPYGKPSTEEPVVRIATFDDTSALTRMHQRCSSDSLRRLYGMAPASPDDKFSRRRLLAGGGALVAAAGGEVVGLATISTCEAGVAEVTLLVEDGWQRQGLGTRLLVAAARLARGQGAEDVVLRSRTQHPGLTKLAFASGLRARARLEGQAVVVTIALDGIKPLAPVPS